MTPDPFDPRLVLGASGLLGEVNRAGVLTSADVHVALRLGRLGREGDERVLLAAALAVRAARTGSVCLDLADVGALAAEEADDGAAAGALPWPDAGVWAASLATSPLVAVGPDGPSDRPLRWARGLLYLDRYWRDEERVRAAVEHRLAGTLPVDPGALAEALARLFPGPGDAPRRLAAAACAASRLAVLTGGPGTGKTTTVARLLAVLRALPGPDLRVALAAPTGKAAARLTEAVAEEVARLAPADRERVGAPSATTVHRLLGWRAGSATRFRHHAGRRLPHDVVVVDESSMMSLPLIARLLEALHPDARLLLVGDPDQLASVEAGAVLGDLVARPPGSTGLVRALRALVPADLPTDRTDLARLAGGVVRLEVVHRHGGAIAELAGAIRDGRADDAVAVLTSRGAARLVETAGERPSDEEVAGLRADATQAGTALVAAARAGEAGAALRALDEHRLLLAHRHGAFGATTWAERVEAWVAQASALERSPGGWYAGRPLLVTANDRVTGLANGDTGVLVADRAGGLVAAFGHPERPTLVRPHRLPAVETVHALTVHRAQGSQFTTVSVVLPPAASPLLTRELLYTAVTRATEAVRVVGTTAAVRAAVDRPIRRASGLRRRG